MGYGQEPSLEGTLLSKVPLPGMSISKFKIIRELDC